MPSEAKHPWPRVTDSSGFALRMPRLCLPYPQLIFGQLHDNPLALGPVRRSGQIGHDGLAPHQRAARLVTLAEKEKRFKASIELVGALATVAAHGGRYADLLRADGDVARRARDHL